MKTQCKNCGKDVVGRSDKKFCNEACKNMYHNKNGTVAGKGSRTNRKILTDLTRTGIHSIATDELATTGFNFKAITGVEFTSGEVKLLCYEFYLEKKGNAFLIKEA
jgi:hypothetical protein